MPINKIAEHKRYNATVIFRHIFIFLSLLFVFPAYGKEVKTEQLLLAVPALLNSQPSADFLSVLNSAFFCLGKEKTALKVNIVSDDILAEKYAKIILHSYGLKNEQIEMLTSVRSLRSGDISGLTVVGTLSLKDRYYLRQGGITYATVPRSDNRISASSKHNTRSFDTAIIVLGTAPLDETTPSLDMVRRVETGTGLLKKNPHAVLIFSGGRTGGPISEAKMMALMAYAKGIAPSEIILEEDSLSTVENAQYVVRIVKTLQVKRFILVSRSTHLKRAVSIFVTYPEFKNLETAASTISKEEIRGNLEEYLAFRDSERVRQILHKIMSEF